MVFSELRISPVRRALATGAPAALGLVLVVVAAREPGLHVLARALLVALGLGAVAQARAVWRGTGRHLVLDAEAIRDSAGVVVAPLGAIVSVDAGFFAFKPSNGFLLRLDEPRPPLWVPGLYWRRGTRVGIGGAPSGRAAREFAQLVDLARKGQL